MNRRGYPWHTFGGGRLHSVRGWWLKLGPVSLMLYLGWRQSDYWRIALAWMNLGWYKLPQGSDMECEP